MMEILIPILAVTVIGLICAVGLAVASSVMAVKEDTRFTEIRECLPGANCGACGYTGCDGYAKALLEPGTKTNLCVPGADAVAAQIAALLGVAAEDVVEKIAVVQCAGTCEATSVKADYRGIPSCAAAKLFYGGNGSCIFGCMGFGDCVKACPQGAISMQDGIACVNHTACIGCGICAQTCPQKIIEIVPDIIRTEVLCSSYHNGPYTKKVCSSGCIGCHKCEKTCPQGAITVDNFLARIDWNKCTACGACASVCPTGAMVYGDFSGASRVQPFKKTCGASLQQIKWGGRNPGRRFCVSKPAALLLQEVPSACGILLFRLAECEAAAVGAEQALALHARKFGGHGAAVDRQKISQLLPVEGNPEAGTARPTRLCGQISQQLFARRAL